MVERVGKDTGNGQPDSRERIYTATLACFERLGIRGTRMSDVAAEAGVSLPSIYYHYSDREGLIAEVVVRQTRDIYASVRDGLKRNPGKRHIIVSAMLRGIRLAKADPYLSLLIKPDTAKLTARLSESDAVGNVRRAFWHPIFEAARERGELRGDLDREDLLQWLTGIEFMLVTEGEHLGLIDDRKIERQLTQFLVPALVPHPPP